MLITLIISSSHGNPLAQSNITIDNSNDSININTKTLQLNEICKKVSAIGRLMNSNDNDTFEINIGDNLILCRSLVLLNDSTTKINTSDNDNDNNNSNNNDDMIYIVFVYKSNDSNNDNNDNNNNDNNNNNNNNTINSFKIYSLYIGYITIMILNNDIKKCYSKMQQTINDNINSSTFHSIVNSNNNDSCIDDNDDNDIFTNLEDHFLCKVLYVLLNTTTTNDNDNDDNSNTSGTNNRNYDTINWLAPLCKSIPEVAAVDVAYIYSINTTANARLKLKKEYHHYFDNDGFHLDDNWEVAMISYYHYCLKNMDNPHNIPYIYDGALIQVSEDSDVSKHFSPCSQKFSLLVSVILTDTNAKLLLVLKVSQDLLIVDDDRMLYTDYFILSSIETLPIHLYQCWKECLFRVRKAFISKQSIYYIARTINNSIETYDAILKNCTSVSDFHKLIPIPPIPKKPSSQNRRPGRKITSK